MSKASDRYHADDVGCPVPSLSASVAKILLDQSPRHAWTAHPKLNPHYQPDERSMFDLGSAAHALMLGDPQQFMIVEADDWRTKNARQKRDEARVAGLIPILDKDMARTEEMVAAGRLQLKAHAEAAAVFTGGTAEQVITWQEGDVWCRAMLDYIYPNTAIIDDYKTTGGSANPETWVGQLFDRGYDIQAAFYSRGARKLFDTDPTFRFIVQENEPPYALSVVGLQPGILDMAKRKVERAIELWGQCMKTNRWPGYPSRTCYPDMPGYADRRWTEREDKEEHDPAFRDLVDTWLNWQAP